MTTELPPASRRGILKASLVGLATLAGSGLATAAAPKPVAAAARPAGKVRNVIMLVPDGMSTGSLSLLDMHSRLTTGKPSFWNRLRARAGTRHATHTTYAHESLVTDSAAASSAWSTGIKHKIKHLCITPDGRQPRPILMRAKAAGYKVGCVTTTTITHATPAGFYCNAPERNDEKAIGEQLIERGIDLAIGGGAKHVDPALEAAQAAGKAMGLLVARSMDGLRVAVENPAPRILGLMASDHVPYVIDRRGPAREQFNLAEAAVLAARRLSAGGSPFFLQVEAGRIDHAAHNNDAPALLGEMLEYDATLEALVAYTDQNPGTLLVTVADHATANPGLTLYGPAGRLGMERTAAATHSLEWILASVAKTTQKEVRGLELAKLAEQHLGIPLGDDAPRLLQNVYDAIAVDPFTARSTAYGVLGSLAANQFGVGFISINHSADAVDLLAVGAGSDGLPGLIDNTELHDWFTSLLGLAPALS